MSDTETTGTTPVFRFPFKIKIKGEATVTNPEPQKEPDDGAQRQS